MTDLQTSLIAIGAAIVVGVISFNKWQEYRARKSVERAFGAAPNDVLMSPEERVEPGIHSASTHLEQAMPSESSGDPDAFAGGNDGFATANLTPTARDLPVDDVIDCAISLTLEQPLRGEKILAPTQRLRHVGSKPVHYIGLPEHGEWEPIVHGATYSALQAGVQLANRSGPLNEIEYSELVSQLRDVADELGADADIPDMIVVMQSARALAQFVSEFDAQLSVNIVSNEGPWLIATLLTALEKQGFDLRPEGRLVMPDGDGGVLFSLSTNVTLASDTTSRLTLLLDVARVAQPRNGFAAMTACCRSLAMRMNGTVVDDSDQALSEAALGEIAGQVGEFYANMEAAGIAAGSVRALRLFS